MDGNRIKFTTRRVMEIPPPTAGERVIFDTVAPGLALRIRYSGGRSWVFIYRLPGAGRGKAPRKVTIGDATRWSVDEARREAARLRGEVVDRRDPAAERSASRKAAKEAREAQAAQDARIRLPAALDAYEAHLERRGVRNKALAMSVLRRHLMGEEPADGEERIGLGPMAVQDIDRASVMAQIDRLAAQGSPGAAQDLRAKASTFLSWAASRGHIEANPIAGMRLERSTRAQRIASTGRTLSNEELKVIWKACEHPSINRAFGDLVRTLILTGQRKGETSKMRWADLEVMPGWWVIPADLTKNGHSHEVPVPPTLRRIIARQPRFDACPWVFTTNGKTPISGWTKLLAKLNEAADLSEPWTPHDLRRTYRTGLARLGAEDRLAELMINHRPRDLQSIYDREPRFDARRDLARRWTTTVLRRLRRGA